MFKKHFYSDRGLYFRKLNDSLVVKTGKFQIILKNQNKGIQELKQFDFQKLNYFNKEKSTSSEKLLNSRVSETSSFEFNSRSSSTLKVRYTVLLEN